MIKKIFVSLLTSYVSLNACAYPFKNIIFFGDSLSDNGNLYDTLKIPKSPPYYKGHFSNGPVWSEYVGDYFKEQYDTKYKDFAVGGSTAILRSPTDGALPYTLKDQIDKYLKTDYSVNETLYSIWIGANDYLDEKKQDPDKLVSEVISEIVSNTKTLIDKGGKHFLMMDLPDLTKTPYVENFNDEEKQRMIKLSELHHIKLAEAIKTLEKDYPEVKFYTVDVYSVFSNMVTNLNFINQKYNQHFNNADTACWPGGYVYKNGNHSVSASISEAESTAAAYVQGKKPCENPENYIFWDHLHPTTATHSVLSQIIIEKLL